jgi:hypothetical protein
MAPFGTRPGTDVDVPWPIGQRTRRGEKPHKSADFRLGHRRRNYARVVSDVDKYDNPTPKTWTTRYRISMAIGTGFLTALCFWLLFTGGTTEKSIGGVGLAALVFWVFVFRTLYRRGY